MTNREKAKGLLRLSRTALSEDESLEFMIQAIELISGKKPKKPPSESPPVWESYLTAFKKSHGVEPHRDVRTNATISHIIKRVGAEIAVDLVRFYCEQMDPFYMKTLHPITLCYRDIEMLMARMKGARVITQKEANKIETISANARKSVEYLKRKHGA